MVGQVRGKPSCPHESVDKEQVRKKTVALFAQNKRSLLELRGPDKTKVWELLPWDTVDGKTGEESLGLEEAFRPAWSRQKSNLSYYFFLNRNQKYLMKTTESEKSYNQYVKNRLTEEASQEQGKEK